MSANPEKFPQEVIDNVQNYHMREGNLKDEFEVSYFNFLAVVEEWKVCKLYEFTWHKYVRRSLSRFYRLLGTGIYED